MTASSALLLVLGIPTSTIVTELPALTLVTALPALTLCLLACLSRRHLQILQRATAARHATKPPATPAGQHRQAAQQGSCEWDGWKPPFHAYLPATMAIKVSDDDGGDDGGDEDSASSEVR